MDASALRERHVVLDESTVVVFIEGGDAPQFVPLDHAAAEFLKVTPSCPRLARAAIRARDAVSRNAPCPCGSGKKFKRCCR